MKNFILLTLLLCFTKGVSQSVKDSLLNKEHSLVDDRLHLAGYLDQCATTYFLKSPQEKAKTNFLRYYREIIIGYNPVQSINIPEYLGFKTGQEPKDIQSLCDIVYAKNIETIIALTDRYGYPSYQRMRTNEYKDSHYASMLFILRYDAYDKKLRKIFKGEKELGNMSEKEYNHFTFIMKRKKIMTEEDVKWLEKNAGIKHTFKNVRVK